MVRKTKNVESSPIRVFFRKVGVLGLLLAGTVLLYSASQNQNPTESGNPEDSTEAIPHTAAYPDAEGETAPETAAASPEETTPPEAPEGYPGGYVEMPSRTPVSEVSTTPETAPETTAAENTAPENTAAEATPETSPAPAATAETSVPSVPETVATETPAPAPAPTAASDTPPTTAPLISRPATPPLQSVAGPPVNNFLEIFDFNVNPDWVTARWSFVTSVGPLNTRGFRVPLCTGTSKSDLVGNLTYYFDRNLEVEKITFEGYTGDLDRLIITLRYFHMEKRMTADPNVLLYESPPLAQRAKSYMKSYFRTTSITENPNHRFWITMELYPEEEE